ncbi:hypothetical protein [Polycladidibacter stylochi]|uniref:hypothetical protein n=1 Tax=Polycladidibacter stylochi TaxID=1807766 RepID=UPI00082BFCEE|nr:hypothetical protein [Pseudovibrio stylochi]
MTLNIPLLTACLGFAAGIFTVLSFLEKPVWPMMLNANSHAVVNTEVKAVHGILNRLIRMLPPTMMLTMLVVSCLLIERLISSDFAKPEISMATLFFGQMIIVVALLKSRIDGVKNVAADEDIIKLRKGLGALTQLHHMGLAAAISTLCLQLYYLS